MKPVRVLSAAVATVALAVTAGSAASAQDLRVLDEAYTQLITQEISGDAAYDHIRYMTHFHRPGGGSDGLWAVAEYFDEKAREFGLSNVQLIKQASTRRPWNAEFADLWIVEPEPERIASTLQSVLHLADNSRPADVTGELIDIGAGQEEDYEGKEVAGKILLTYGSSFQAMRRGVCERGAAGVVWYPSPFSSDMGISGAGVSRPDQLRWISVPSRGSDECEPTFAFNLSTRQGVALRNRLQQSSEPIVAHAVVQSAFDSEQGSEPWQVMVEAFIPGTDPSSGQDIVLTGHLQEEGTSANDDASGCASTLEVARALNKLINEGRLPRPKRNLRFWWVNEISSQRQYFADNPEAHLSMWVNVNQDMVGANQAQDVMRKQNITRLPATRFHFYNDVVEAVIEYMVAGNTFELAQMSQGHLLYPKPHMSHLGTQHRFNAEMIFFHTSTDHMTFLEAPIGVPGVTFTNMPDRFIHSSDDDLWNIDRTQLGRAAASVALIAYTMASVDGTDVPVLAAETVGRGISRLGANTGIALSMISAADDKASVYFEALDQVWYAVEREKMALRSLEEVDPIVGGYVSRLSGELDRRQSQALRDLTVTYRELTGDNPPSRRQESEAMQQLSGMTPTLVAGPTEFLTGRRQVGFVRGLNGLMGFEIMSAVNGHRSGFDIYRYVAAEAREAGEHYYGTVTPEAVLQYLQNAANAELISLE
jgi:hypothetical protein